MLKQVISIYTGFLFFVVLSCLESNASREGVASYFSSWHNSTHAHSRRDVNFPWQKEKLRLKLIPVMEILIGLFKKNNLALILWPILYVPIIFSSTLICESHPYTYSPEKSGFYDLGNMWTQRCKIQFAPAYFSLAPFTWKPSWCVRLQNPCGQGRSMPSAFKQVQRMAREPT